MKEAHAAVDKAIDECARLRRVLTRNKSAQVRGADEKGLAKATGLSWFNNCRPEIEKVIGGELLQDGDALYRNLISASDRATSRERYKVLLKSIKGELISIREYILSPTSPANGTSDKAPDFSSLIPDRSMQSILTRRWNECVRCINAKAPLAATVMMGGLLEGLLLARVNRETDKRTVFGAAKAPKDRVSGKTLQLKEWTLRHYIDVAHELEWISTSAKDVGEVVRDYRNYIHPQKELSHGIVIQNDDALLFWEISKSICRQLL